jgi:hypothetical protein
MFDKSNRCFTSGLCTSIIVCSWVSSRMRHVSDKHCERITSFQISSVSFPPQKSCLLLDNVKNTIRSREATDDNIIRRMRLVWCVTKATETHSEHAILIALPRQQYANAPECYIYTSLPVFTLYLLPSNFGPHSKGCFDLLFITSPWLAQRCLWWTRLTSLLQAISAVSLYRHVPSTCILNN